jgi:drug/metabolite transporter (DMT)-like permease
LSGTTFGRQPSVSPTAIILVLVAAVAHASWNLFSKQASATGAAFFLWLLAASVTVIYLPVAAVAAAVSHPHLTALNWVFMVGTGVLQAAYFLFLQLGYRLGDLSLVYPIGRGTGALLAAVAGIVLLGERPGPVGIAGIVAIIGGVILISLPNRDSSAIAQAGQVRAGPKAIAFALVTGMFIAVYTLWDKHAMAALHTPPVLQGYAAFPFMVLAFWPFVTGDRARLRQVWRSFRPQVLGAAVLAPLAYILVLAALSFTAVSAIAPAREVSVLFGVMLGRRMLGEHGLARRLGAATAIVAGVIAIALG